MSELKASDLRVGNLLQRGELGFVTVKRIILNEDDVLINESIGLFTLGYNLTPILLTEEILLKCGFEKNENGLFKRILNHKLDVSKLTFRTDEGFICFDDGIKMRTLLTHITYLHQLQNLIHSLSGKELKINL